MSRTSECSSIHCYTRAMIGCALASAMSAVISLNTTAQAQHTAPNDSPRTSFWITGSRPSDLSLSPDGQILYAGGDHRGAGPATGVFTAADLESGEVLTGDLEARLYGGEARAIARDGAGGWFVGGEFGVEGSTSFTRLARILPDGSFDPACPDVDGEVHALVHIDDTIVIGGDFEGVGAASDRFNLAAIDASTCKVLPWAPVVTDEEGDEGGAIVSALEVIDSTVYAVGSFGKVDGVVRNDAAAINLTNGDLLPWHPDTGVSGNMSAVLAVGGEVYVGGCFSTINGEPRANLAATDPVSGAVTAWNPVLNQCVSALASESGQLYVGGRFTNVDGQQRERIAAFDVESGALLPWAASVTENDGAATDVHDIEPHEDAVYIAGSFLSVNGELRHHVAVVNAADGSLRPRRINAVGPFSTYVQDLELHRGRLAAGGKFGSLGAELFSGVTSFNTSTGQAIPEWAPTVERESGDTAFRPGLVLATVRSGDRVYIGGDIARVNGTERSGVAAVDAETGELITDFAPDVAGYVTNMLLSGSTLYIGGRFGAVDGVPRVHLAAIDVATGDVINSWDGGVGLPIPLAVEDMALSQDGSTLYVAGGFGTAGNGTDTASWPVRRDFAAFDASTGELLAWNTHPESGSDGWAVHDDGEHVWVGGSFRYFEPMPNELYHRIGVGRLERNDAFPTDWSTWLDGGGVPSGVRAIARRGDAVYLGGRFAELGANWMGGSSPEEPVYRSDLAMMDAAAPTTVLDWNPHPNGASVEDIEVSQQAVYVAGDFGTMGLNFRFRPGLAVFDFPCPADLDGDGVVNGADLGILLGLWGSDDSLADLTGDQLVNGADLGELLGAWGTCD